MTSPRATHPRAHTDRLHYGMVISGAVWLEAQGHGAEPGNVLAGLEPSSQEGRRKGRSFHTEKNRLDLSKNYFMKEAIPRVTYRGCKILGKTIRQ